MSMNIVFQKEEIEDIIRRHKNKETDREIGKAIYFRY